MSEPTAVAKFSLLRDVLRLAREQRAALEGNDLDRFQQLLEAREALLQDVGILDERGEPLPPNVITFPIPRQVAAEDTLALDAVIKGILDHDRENEQLLARRMAEIRRQLPALEEGRRAAGAYRMTSAPPTFIDRVS